MAPLEGADQRAVELFRKGAQLEAAGIIKEAADSYKKAFKLNQFADRLSVRLEKEEGQAAGEDADETLKEKESDIEQTHEADGDVKECLFLRLPPEVIAAILVQVALYSPRDLIRIALAGRIFWLPHDSPLFWEPMCVQAYGENAGDSVGTYGGWFQMFRERPAIRFDGVYASRSMYLRTGEHEGISWYPPLIEVSYYRYIRFYPDGIVRVLLCNDPPSHILPFHDHRRTLWGQWDLDTKKKEVYLVTQGSVPEYEFYLQLKVSSSGGKVHNKLKWVNYWCIHRATGQRDDFDLTNDRSFYFQKCD